MHAFHFYWSFDAENIHKFLVKSYEINQTFNIISIYDITCEIENWIPRTIDFSHVRPYLPKIPQITMMIIIWYSIISFFTFMFKHVHVIITY